MIIRPARCEEVIDLRHKVLRQGLPPETAIFPGDEDPTAQHFVVEANSKVIGCVTLHLNHWQTEPAWQLRGMAVAHTHQRQGVGSLLLRAVDEAVSQSTPTLLWCNARTPAAPFYEKHGWTIESEVFEIPTAGPHVKMIKRLELA